MSADIGLPGRLPGLFFVGFSCRMYVQHSQHALDSRPRSRSHRLSKQIHTTKLASGGGITFLNHPITPALTSQCWYLFPTRIVVCCSNQLSPLTQTLICSWLLIDTSNRYTAPCTSSQRASSASWKHRAEVSTGD